MSAVVGQYPRERAANPFDASRFAPGAIPWIETEAGEMEHWLARAIAPGARHQILGAHGSGKSTLLVHLARRARAKGVRVVAFRGAQPTSLATLLARAPRAGGLVLVDEVAEMSKVRFACVRALATATGHGLVVSTHRDRGFATLTHRRVDDALATEIVGWLARDGGRDAFAPPPLAPLLAAHDGNLREVCFTLYDCWAGR